MFTFSQTPLYSLSIIIYKKSNTITSQKLQESSNFYMQYIHVKDIKYNQFFFKQKFTDMIYRNGGH